MLPAIGPHLVQSSELGDALKRFAALERIEWSAQWGVGAWLLLAGALCDLAGRLLGR